MDEMFKMSSFTKMFSTLMPLVRKSVGHRQKLLNPLTLNSLYMFNQNLHSNWGEKWDLHLSVQLNYYYVGKYSVYIFYVGKYAVHCMNELQIYSSLKPNGTYYWEPWIYVSSAPLNVPHKLIELNTAVNLPP